MDKKLTIERSMTDFKAAYQAKRKLIERQKEDHLFALGEQWSAEDAQKVKDAGMKPIVDNRIAPLIFLVTGLQRQNRTDFKAYPEGEEDSLKAEIASSLFKHAIKTSEFGYKFSDQFKNGITCGESNMELYLDWTENILNGKPCWKEIHGNRVFPDPSAKEYDYSDGRYVYKVTFDLTKDELISLYPEMDRKIEKAEEGKIDLSSISGGEVHSQPRDYKKDGDSSKSEPEEGTFDLIERQYKKWVEKCYVGDKQTGEIKEAEDKEKAESFITNYKFEIEQEKMAYQQQVGQFEQMNSMMLSGQVPVDPMATPLQPPIEPVQRNPDRFILIKRKVPEIWIFAHVPGIKEPLADERAWFYPKWKKYNIFPFFARHSTAPLEGDQRHLLIQGMVHGVKGVQEKHNKAEMLMLRHLNSAANSGWLTPENSWVDRKKVEEFGSQPGVNLEYTGQIKPERIYPMPLSNGHAQVAMDSAEAIKAQSGVNADLLAAQEGGTDSGRAIALRQRQGLVMVQEPFDNASRTQKLCGQFLLSQMGEVYDTETAKKVLGDAFLQKNFPPPMLLDPMGQQVPMPDPKTGQPMAYDAQMAELAIAEVLSGDLANYDVSVGEAVASETMKMANSSEVKDIATAYPGLVPPEILIEESQLPQATKNKILSAVKNAQAMAQMTAGNVPPKAKAEAA